MADEKEVVKPSKAEVKKTEAKAEAKIEAKQVEVEQTPTTNKVKVFVPRAFKYTTETHAIIDVQAGHQELDAEIANHWWAKANGVELV